MMTNKERYKQAFSTLHASNQISLEVREMEKKDRHFSVNRIAVAMGMLLLCCSVLYWSQSVYAYTDATAKVFMETTVDENEIDKIQTEIEQLDGVKDVKYVSADQAWEDFKQEYFSDENSKDLLDDFTENPLADCQNFQMKVLKSADVKELQKQIEGIEGVRLVNIDME